MIIGEWIKSSYSDGDIDDGGIDCVEVMLHESGGWSVRDSKDPHGPVLNFTPGEVSAFVQGVRAGEFGA